MRAADYGDGSELVRVIEWRDLPDDRADAEHAAMVAGTGASQTNRVVEDAVSDRCPICGRADCRREVTAAADRKPAKVTKKQRERDALRAYEAWRAKRYAMGIVKGLVEHNDPYRHFEVQWYFQEHKQIALDLGWIAQEGDKLIVTIDGVAAYGRLGLAKLPDGRVHFWQNPPTEVVVDAQSELAGANKDVGMETCAANSAAVDGGDHNDVRSNTVRV